jgi:hypothetical protein
MRQEQIRQAVSDFLSAKGYEVLDLFYKMPCDSCLSIEKWDKFNLLPDLLLKEKGELFLAFILLNDTRLDRIKSYITKYSGILPFKLFQIEGSNVYEIKNIESVSKRDLIGKDLSIKDASLVGTTSRTFKSQAGKWEEQRKIGLKGEEEVIEILNASRARIIDLNFNAPCDSCSNIQNWRKYNKLPDGIVKTKSDLFFYDAKSKRSRKLCVNERDYKEYQDKLKFLPVNVYFVIFSYDLKKIKEMYSHKVNLNAHKKEKEWDGNYTVDLSNEVEQLA